MSRTETTIIWLRGLRKRLSAFFTPFSLHKQTQRHGHTTQTKQPKAARLSLAPIVERDLIGGLRWKKDERRKRWEEKKMRRESRGEENREQKGLEQHEQESSLTLLTVICRPHTHAHAHTNRVTHVQSTPQTHTHPIYPAKNTFLPLHKHTCTQSLTQCTSLSATLTGICCPLPLNRHEQAQLTP